MSPVTSQKDLDRRGVVKALTLASTVVVLAVGASGCATKGHVNREIAALRNQMETSNAELRGDLTDIRNSVDQALARSEAANGLAGSARDIALGKHGYREVARYTVPFNFNGDEMTADDELAIEEIATRMASNPHYLADLSGYTDSRGPTRYNYDLGRRRAEAVLRALAERVPGSLHRFAAVSFGESGSENWAGDDSDRRRVEISLIERVPETDSSSDDDSDGPISLSN